MDVITDLVAQSKILISANHEVDFLEISLLLEKFVIRMGGVVDDRYKDNEFYTQVVFLGNEYYDYIANFKSDYGPMIENKLGITAQVVEFVANYITEIKHHNCSLLKIVKVNHTSNYNTKDRLRISSVPKLSRFGTETINAIHPKYHLEDIYRRLYSPSYANDWEAIELDRVATHTEWNIDSAIKTLGGKQKNTRSHNNYSEFVRIKQKAYKILAKYVYSTDYDRVVPIGICSSENITKVIEILSQYYDKLSYTMQPSKSLYDHRINAAVIKSDTKTVIKLWLIVDYELIPVIDEGDRKSAHIDVSLRLCLNEHIAYDMLGLDDIAKGKLTLLRLLLAKRQSLLTRKIMADPSKCEFVGVDCPLNVGLKMMRIQRIQKRFKNR
jgi:hypothetical protein